jgi:hypothetical protein
MFFVDKPLPIGLYTVSQISTFNIKQLLSSPLPHKTPSFNNAFVFFRYIFYKANYSSMQHGTFQHFHKKLKILDTIPSFLLNVKIRTQN